MTDKGYKTACKKEMQDLKAGREEISHLAEKFEFRDICSEEGAEAAGIEAVCFPPNEACSEKMMLERAARVPDLFLVAVDRASGRIAGFLNGLATDEERLRDAFFTDAGLHRPEGHTVMLLGLDVLPEYRGMGLARELVRRYAEREREKGRCALRLTCVPAKVKMYEKMGFQDEGISDSVWGGVVWNEMSRSLVLPGEEKARKDIG